MPDIYLDEMCEALAFETGKTVSKATAWRMMEEGGFTMKKVGISFISYTIKRSLTTSQITKVAAERSLEAREDYIDRISYYSPQQLVFVDESAVDRRTTYRSRAWSIRGTKAQRKTFFTRGKR